jgi:hypothetical protein
MSEKDIAELLREILLNCNKVMGRESDYAKGYSDALEAALSIVDSSFKPKCLLGGENEKQN